MFLLLENVCGLEGQALLLHLKEATVNHGLRLRPFILHLCASGSLRGKELAHRTSCDVLQSGCSPSHTRMPLLYSEDALPLKRGCLSGSWPGRELSGFFLQRKKKKQFSICLSYKILNSNRTKHTFSWLLGVWKILLFYERIHFTSFILSQQWP